MSRSARRIIAWTVLCIAFTVQAEAIGAQRMRGTAITEERLALVIGNAAYIRDPLDNPVNDARLIAQSLRQSGFAVALHENLDRAALIEALREFGKRLTENTIAVVYYAGHGLQLRDHNYLIPIDADIRSEDEIPVAGLDIGFILGRMSTARSRVNIVILDACRNNPFSARGGTKAQGLAQMDAPVGTLLAYATAPGKLAADGNAGANSLYAMHLGRQLLSPGLPVEHVFKRVREAVVRDTRQQQVPWESSSLQGEFAFVPGVVAAEAAASDAEAAGEIAFWNSIQSAARVDEYKAYLRQYPGGRFAALAQTRIAAYTPSAPAPSARPTRADTLPHVGDTWRYRVQDQFRIGDLFLTAKVDEVLADGVAESWSTTSDAKLRTTVVKLEPGFNALPGWTLTPPEFSPYLLAAGRLRSGEPIPDQSLRVENSSVPLHARHEGEEDVVVAAGRFRAVKLALRGQTVSRGVGRNSAVSIEQIVWYSPQVKRTVKFTVALKVGGELRESTTFELMEYTLH